MLRGETGGVLHGCARELGIGTGREGEDDGTGDSEREAALELEPSAFDFLKRLRRDSLECNLRESAPVPADLGRVERTGKDGLIADSSRACGREGRRPGGSGIVWVAGEVELSPERESCARDSWSERIGDTRSGLTSGSDVPPVAESVWSTERLKCKRFRKEASKCSTGQ